MIRKLIDKRYFLFWTLPHQPNYRFHQLSFLKALQPHQQLPNKQKSIKNNFEILKPIHLIEVYSESKHFVLFRISFIKVYGHVRIFVWCMRILNETVATWIVQNLLKVNKKTVFQKKNKNISFLTISNSPNLNSLRSASFCANSLIFSAKSASTSFFISTSASKFEIVRSIIPSTVVKTGISKKNSIRSKGQIYDSIKKWWTYILFESSVEFQNREQEFWKVRNLIWSFRDWDRWHLSPKVWVLYQNLELY